MTSFHSVRKNSRIIQDISLCLLYQSSIFDERSKLGDQVNASSLLVHCQLDSYGQKRRAMLATHSLGQLAGNTTLQLHQPLYALSLLIMFLKIGPTNLRQLACVTLSAVMGMSLKKLLHLAQIWHQ